MKDLTIKESNFVRTAPVFNKRDQKVTPVNPICNPQTVNLCAMLGIDDPVQVVLARAGRTMQEPANVDVQIEEPLEEETPHIVVTPSTPSLQCSKLILPEPVTPSVEEIELESVKIVSPDDSVVTVSLDTTEEFATPVSKKTFKRRNMSIYSTPDKDENEGSASLLDTEESPCKLSCNNTL